MKQILIIHGGTCFETKEGYLGLLKKKSVDLDKFRVGNNWKENMAYELKGSYDVLMPKMPCRERAEYEDWSIWFQRIVDNCRSPLILVGHSLGGIFIAKYLSENSIKTTIEKAVLIAAPFDKTGLKESLGDFTPTSSLKNFEEQAGKIYLLHSKDDPVVPFEHLKKYQEKLPKAETLIFEDRKHFNQERFPELIDLFKKDPA
ncbi:MAG: RBBP9/YdeN family alpha/beta hydrolase [Candidatus Paceibacterota bacterium]